MEEKFVVILNGTPVSVEPGENLGTLIAERGLLAMPCGGHGRCGKCRVKVTGAVSEPTLREREVLTAEELESGVRLACQVRALGDCKVTTLEKSAQTQIQTEGEVAAFRLNPRFLTFGAAVDIGTTTLAAKLYDREGSVLAGKTGLNPEAAWGLFLKQKV